MMVVSLQVWQALKRPPIHHPLFRRVSQTHPPSPPRRLSLVERVALLALLLTGIYFLLAYFVSLVLVVIFFVPIVVAGIYMALHGTLAGLYWATRVSAAISRERERGTYELLSVSPHGAFSASWAICTGCQYYDQTFNGIGAQRVWFSRVFFLSIALMGALISLFDPRDYPGNPLEGFLLAVSAIAVLALAFQIDDIHSTVIGSLVGLIVPLFARNRLDARIGAFAGFLVLQTTAYALVWLIGFVLIPQINASLPLSGFAAALSLPLEQLLVFFAVRELIARLLWGLNSWLHDGDVSDLRLLTKGGRLLW